MFSWSVFDFYLLDSPEIPSTLIRNGQDCTCSPGPNIRTENWGSLSLLCFQFPLSPAGPSRGKRGSCAFSLKWRGACMRHPWWTGERILETDTGAEAAEGWGKKYGYENWSERKTGSHGEKWYGQAETDIGSRAVGEDWDMQWQGKQLGMRTGWCRGDERGREDRPAKWPEGKELGLAALGGWDKELGLTQEKLGFFGQRHKLLGEENRDETRSQVGKRWHWDRVWSEEMEQKGSHTETAQKSQY